jgi:hypothetical protein
MGTLRTPAGGSGKGTDTRETLVHNHDERRAPKHRGTREQILSVRGSRAFFPVCRAGRSYYEYLVRMQATLAMEPGGCRFGSRRDVYERNRGLQLCREESLSTSREIARIFTGEYPICNYVENIGTITREISVFNYDARRPAASRRPVRTSTRENPVCSYAERIATIARKNVSCSYSEKPRTRRIAGTFTRENFVRNYCEKGASQSGTITRESAVCNYPEKM